MQPHQQAAGMSTSCTLAEYSVQTHPRTMSPTGSGSDRATTNKGTAAQTAVLRLALPARTAGL